VNISLRTSLVLVVCLLMAVPILPIAASASPLPDAAGCTSDKAANPRPDAWYSLGKPAQYYSDTCFHEFMTNSPDSPTIDVLIVPPPGPLALRDANLVRASVDMWEEGLREGAHTKGMNWLADGMTMNAYVLGEDVPTASALSDPEVVVVLGDSAAVLAWAYAGIGTDAPMELLCHPASPVSGGGFPAAPVLRGMPGFDGHDGSGWGNLNVSCGNNGGRVCFVVGAVAFDTPSAAMARNVYDLASHEFGHCIGLGHVGDASDFGAKAYPPDDIMSYEQDGRDVPYALCVSNLNLKTFAYRYQYLIPGAPQSTDGFHDGSSHVGYMAMAGGADPWASPSGPTGGPLVATSWRVFRPDGSESRSPADCRQPDTALVQLPPILAPPTAEPGSPAMTIDSPTDGATGQPSSLTVSGGVDRAAGSGGGSSSGSYPATDPAVTASYTPFNAGSPLAYSSVVSSVTGQAGDSVPKFVAGQGIDFHSRWAHSSGPNALASDTPVAYYVYDAAGQQVAGPLATTAAAEPTGATSGCGTPPCFDYKATWTTPSTAGHYFFVAAATLGGTAHYITDSGAPGPHPGLKEVEVVAAAAPSAPAAPMSSRTLSGTILSPCTCRNDYSGALSWGFGFPGSPASGAPAGNNLDGLWFDVSADRGSHYSLSASGAQPLGIAFFANGDDADDVGASATLAMPKEDYVPAAASYAFVWHIPDPSITNRNLPNAGVTLLLETAAPTVPSAPLAFQVTAGDAQASLVWNAPATNGGAPIDGYTVHYGTAAGSYTQTASASGTSRTVTGLTNGQAYYFAVTAHNSVGDGAATPEVSATPAAGAVTDERVELYEGSTLLGSTLVSTSAGSPAAAWSVALSGLATGSHTLNAKWFDAGTASTGTPLAAATVAFSVSGTTTTSSSTTTTTTTSASTSADGSTDTGSAGGSVNNVAPVVDSFAATPSVAVIGRDGAVGLAGTAHDDNGNADVASVTVKVTAPGGASTTPAATLANHPSDVTALSFAASYAVDGATEVGTYQVDSFATDAGGAQSPVQAVVFRVLPPPAVHIHYTGAASRLDFGSFNPGAHNLVSANQFAVQNELHGAREFKFDMTDFTCTRGTVPVLGHATLRLGHLDGAGAFVVDSTLPYDAAAASLGTLSDGSELLVQMELGDVPVGIAGTCTASFGLFHT
jgi:hypothetical protein